MRSKRLGVSLAMAGLSAALMGASPADAIENARMPEALSGIREGNAALAPLAFVRFCRNYAAECGSEGPHAPVVLDEAKWRLLELVNREVNRSVAPKSHEGADNWLLGRTQGDCADYAIQKRHRLIALGFPKSALSLTEVTAFGVGHLILIVRTDRGAFALDNLRYGVSHWQSTGYEFVKLQSIDNPDFWVAAAGPENLGPQLFASLELRSAFSE